MDTPTNETTAQAATDQASLPTGKLVLIGIFGPVSNPEGLVRTSGGKIKRVRQGTRLRNATISTIAPDHIVMSHGTTTTVLTFPDTRNGS
ncbi:MAG: hypothetical protein ABJD13_06635 [Paracoccaceae bacterium]